MSDNDDLDLQDDLSDDDLPDDEESDLSEEITIKSAQAKPRPVTGMPKIDSHKGKKGCNKRLPGNQNLRMAEALALFIQGATYEEISEKTGWTLATTKQMLTVHISKRKLELTEEIKNLEERRLDALFRTMFVQAQAGDVKAGKLCLEIMERRAKMFGLDAPKEVHVEQSSVKQIQIVQVSLPEQRLIDAVGRPKLIEAKSSVRTSNGNEIIEAEFLSKDNETQGESVPEETAPKRAGPKPAVRIPDGTYIPGLTNNE